MIKFFRNIRRRLLRENKFTRYLIYAIGEIILVVIGILIALQVNNWNQNKIHKKEEVQRIKLLIQDAKQDSILFSLINQRLKELDTLQKNFLALDNPALRDSVAQLKSPDLSIFGAFLPNQSNVVNNTQGALNTIENDSIKRQIREFHSSYTQLAESLGIYNRHIENQYTPLYIEYSDMFSIKDTINRGLMATFIPILENKKIMAYVKLSRGWGSNAALATGEFLERIQQLKFSLQSYLSDNSYD